MKLKKSETIENIRKRTVFVFNSYKTIKIGVNSTKSRLMINYCSNTFVIW